MKSNSPCVIRVMETFNEFTNGNYSLGSPYFGVTSICGNRSSQDGRYSACALTEEQRFLDGVYDEHGCGTRRILMLQFLNCLHLSFVVLILLFNEQLVQN